VILYLFFYDFVFFVRQFVVYFSELNQESIFYYKKNNIILYLIIILIYILDI